MTTETVKIIERTIEDVESFTNNYWVPLLHKTREEPLEWGSNACSIIEKTIEDRQKYVMKLRTFLRQHRKYAN